MKNPIDHRRATIALLVSFLLHALMQLDILVLDPNTINDTLGVLLKYQDDIARLQGSEAERILSEIKAGLADRAGATA